MTALTDSRLSIIPPALLSRCCTSSALNRCWRARIGRSSRHAMSRSRRRHPVPRSMSFSGSSGSRRQVSFNAWIRRSSKPAGGGGSSGFGTRASWSAASAALCCRSGSSAEGALRAGSSSRSCIDAGLLTGREISGRPVDGDRALASSRPDGLRPDGYAESRPSAGLLAVA